MDRYTLDFTHPPKEPEVIAFHLDKSFFNAIEGSEIQDGDVLVELTITPLSNRLFQLDLTYEGVVIVLCDRCLEPMQIEIKVEDGLEVQLGAFLDDENDEQITLDMQSPIYDFRWIIYELLALHLPIQRLHKMEDCNPEVLKYLVNEMPAEARAE